MFLPLLLVVFGALLVWAAFKNYSVGDILRGKFTPRSG